jgi:hypothetical protein
MTFWSGFSTTAFFVPDLASQEFSDLGFRKHIPDIRFLYWESCFAKMYLFDNDFPSRLRKHFTDNGGVCHAGAL